MTIGERIAYERKELDRVTQNYNDLQNSVNNISYNVNSQIGSIAGRVEEVLHSPFLLQTCVRFRPFPCSTDLPRYSY